MHYRTMGKTGVQVSALGFGCMRLPVKKNRYDAIDEAAASALLRYAVEQGVNYIDTAYTYHASSPDRAGNSEPFLGRALSGNLRQKVMLATKLPGWLVEKPSDMKRFFRLQLKRLQTDYIDFYLLHALDGETWNHLVNMGVCEFLDKLRTEGTIRFAGFSFHDSYEHFTPIVDGYNWDMCQIQYNIFDVENQAGRAGLAYAAAKGLGVSVMEPLRGGALANPPPTVQEIWDRSLTRRSAAEWALRFVWNSPEVSIALSGMNQQSQLEENLRTAAAALPNTLTRADLALVDEVRAVYASRIQVPCTGCRYCMPCPAGVNIPGIFEIINEASMLGDLTSVQEDIAATADEEGPQLCIGCGACEAACPQHIPVRHHLNRISREYL